MDVKLNDIQPFIPFAKNSEGGITSFIKLASEKGERDVIFDNGFTKLFINMKDNVLDIFKIFLDLLVGLKCIFQKI